MRRRAELAEEEARASARRRTIEQEEAAAREAARLRIEAEEAAAKEAARRRIEADEVAAREAAAKRLAVEEEEQRRAIARIKLEEEEAVARAAVRRRVEEEEATAREVSRRRLEEEEAAAREAAAARRQAEEDEVAFREAARRQEADEQAAREAAQRWDQAMAEEAARQAVEQAGANAPAPEALPAAPGAPQMMAAMQSASAPTQGSPHVLAAAASPPPPPPSGGAPPGGGHPVALFVAAVHALQAECAAGRDGASRVAPVQGASRGLLPIARRLEQTGDISTADELRRGAAAMQEAFDAAAVLQIAVALCARLLSLQQPGSHPGSRPGSRPAAPSPAKPAAAAAAEAEAAEAEDPAGVELARLREQNERLAAERDELAALAQSARNADTSPAGVANSPGGEPPAGPPPTGPSMRRRRRVGPDAAGGELPEQPAVAEPEEAARAVKLELEPECSEPELKLRPPSDGVVSVTVVGCKGLLAADFGGKSDPYVTVGLGVGKAVQRTKTVKGTLVPSFEESFDFSVAARGAPEDYWLAIEVHDADKIGKDDLLGLLAVDIVSAFGEAVGRGTPASPQGWVAFGAAAVTRWWDLSDGDRKVPAKLVKSGSGPNPCGSVQLRLTFAGVAKEVATSQASPAAAVQPAAPVAVVLSPPRATEQVAAGQSDTDDGSISGWLAEEEAAAAVCMPLEPALALAPPPELEPEPLELAPEPVPELEPVRVPEHVHVLELELEPEPEPAKEPERAAEPEPAPETEVQAAEAVAAAAEAAAAAAIAAAGAAAAVAKVAREAAAAVVAVEEGVKAAAMAEAAAEAASIAATVEENLRALLTALLVNNKPTNPNS